MMRSCDSSIAALKKAKSLTKKAGRHSCQIQKTLEEVINMERARGRVSTKADGGNAGAERSHVSGFHNNRYKSGVKNIAI
jgi:hypothetical protein